MYDVQKNVVGESMNEAMAEERNAETRKKCYRGSWQLAGLSTFSGGNVNDRGNSGSNPVLSLPVLDTDMYSQLSPVRETMTLPPNIIERSPACRAAPQINESPRSMASRPSPFLVGPQTTVFRYMTSSPPTK